MNFEISVSLWSQVVVMPIMLTFKSKLPMQLSKAEMAVVIPEHGICDVSLVKVLAYYLVDSLCSVEHVILHVYKMKMHQMFYRIFFSIKPMFGRQWIS